MRKLMTFSLGIELSRVCVYRMCIQCDSFYQKVRACIMNRPTSAGLPSVLVGLSDLPDYFI